MNEPLPEDLLSAYLDGECSDTERAAVEAMFEHNAAWRAVLDDVRIARDAVRALPLAEPPAGFLASLTVVRRHARRPRTIAALSAAAAIVAGFILASPSGRGRDVTPPIATLSDSHGATSTLQSDPVTSLAPIAVTPDLEP